MGYYSRLSKSFKKAPHLPLTERSRYVLFSDCHRGIGNTNDNFLKNQNLFLAALQYYYHQGYTYIELGDGDELWENRSIEHIIETYSSIFLLLTKFLEQGRLYMLYGNHDIVKKKSYYNLKYCSYSCHLESASYWEKYSPFPNMVFHSGIILENHLPKQTAVSPSTQPMDVYLTHGHQTDLLNSTLWPLSRFLVRYLWKPLEHLGIMDPTSAAKNYTRKRKTENRLHHWAKKENHILITGHTHRPFLSAEDGYYCNTGSCIHPQGITCLEIRLGQLRLVKWVLDIRPDLSLYAARQVVSGPLSLFPYSSATG